MAVVAMMVATPTASNAQAAGYCGVTGWQWRQTATYTVNSPWCIQSGGNNNDVRLVWQLDGNFVAYVNNGTSWTALWDSGTSGRGWKIAFQSDGNIVITDSSNNVLTALNRWGTGWLSGTTWRQGLVPVYRIVTVPYDGSDIRVGALTSVVNGYYGCGNPSCQAQWIINGAGGVKGSL